MPARCGVHEFKFTVALRPQRPCGLLGMGSSGRPPPLSHSSCALGELRTATSTFTQLLCSWGAPDGHLHFHTAPVLLGSSGRPPPLSHSSCALGELRTATSTFTQLLCSWGAPDGHLHFHTAPVLLGSSGRPPPLSHSSCALC